MRGKGTAIRAEPADQLRLLDLQSVDTAIAQLLHKRKTLPEHAEAAGIGRRREELDERLVAADTRVSDLELAQRRAEEDLEPVRARKARDQERIDSGSVGDAKALTAMIDEVTHLTRRIADLEDAELEVMEELEAATAERDELRRERDGIDAELAEVIRRRDAAVAEIGRAGAELTGERRQLVPLLPAPLVELYEKVRAAHGGLGAAALSQRRCLGCQLEANAADLRGYAAASVEQVLRCEECGRILVRTADSGL